MAARTTFAPVRPLLVTVVGALVIACAVTTSAWAIETAFLPPPERGDVAALTAVTQLQRHRFVESSLRIDGGAVLRGRCLAGRYPQRGDLLRLGREASVLAAGRHTLVVDGAVRGNPVASLLLGGCPGVLGGTVDRLVQSGAKTTVARAWFDRPAVAVRMSDRSARLTLYLTPKRDFLLGVAVDSPRVFGVSRVRALALTPARLALVEGRP
jgi:hypothetical protein